MDGLDKHKLYKSLLENKGEDKILEELVESSCELVHSVMRVIQAKRKKIDLRPDLDNLALAIGNEEIATEQAEELVGAGLVLEQKDRRLKSLGTRAEFKPADMVD
jgi:hypothetical protein